MRLVKMARLRDVDLDSLLRDLGYDDVFISRLSAEERRYILNILQEEIEQGRSAQLDRLWSVDYREKPVDIDTFIDDEFYLGSILRRVSDSGKVESAIYPKWREELRTIFSGGVKEVVLTGAIGIGKTTIAVLIILYDLYRMSCLHNPHDFYRLVRGSTIAIGLYNVYKYKIETTSFPLLKSWVERSPYFKERFATDPRKTTRLLFPHNIVVISGSSELHAIGDNLYGALIDEANFMKVSGGEEELNQALALHQSVKRRQESRFVTQPGMLCLVSSTRFQSSYTIEYIRNNENNPRVHICSFSLWDVKPRDLYSGYTFRVQLGSERISSRILAPDEEPDEGTAVLEVPIEHRGPFEEDIDSALRDVAGVATYSFSTLIPSRSKVFECVDETLVHPFSKTSVVLPLDSKIQLSDFIETNRLFSIEASRYVPKINPGVQRFVHVDLALTGCAVGFAMGHVAKVKSDKVISADGSVYYDQVPEIIIDLMLRIEAPRNSETDLGKIREFIYWLNSHGYAICSVTYDGYQSADSIQILKKAGINAGKLSVDRTEPKNPDAAYICLRNAIINKHVRYYYYEPLLDEVLNLQYDAEKRKVDHSKRMLTIGGKVVTGSKDVSDAVAAVVYKCYQSVAEMTTPIHSGIEPKAEGVTPITEEGIGWLLDDYEDNVQGIIL